MKNKWGDLDTWDEEDDDLEALAKWFEMRFPPVNLYSVPKLHPIVKKGESDEA